MSKPNLMDSLINRAYASSRFAINANDNNRSSNSTWKYDWFTPLVQDDHVAVQNMANSERNTAKKYPFRYKKWIPVLEAEEPEQGQQFGDGNSNTNSNETLKPLDLSKFDTKLVQNMLNRKLGERVSGSNADRNTGDDDDSLTVEDIRGAVGNSDSIPGLSSSLSSTTAQSKTRATVDQTAREKKDEATASGAGSSTTSTTTTETTGTAATAATDTNTTIVASKVTDISEAQSGIEALPNNGDDDDAKLETGESNSPVPDVDSSSKPTESSAGTVATENPTVEPDGSPGDTDSPTGTGSDGGKPAEDTSENQPYLEEQLTNGSDKDQGQSQSQSQNEAEEKDVEMED